MRTGVANSSCRNSEGELITCELRSMNQQTRVYCLVIYDDDPPQGTGRPAPMLLDAEVAGWLCEQVRERFPEVWEQQRSLQ